MLRKTLRWLNSKPASLALKQGDFEELFGIKQLNQLNYLSSSPVTTLKLQIQNVYATLELKTKDS